MKNLLLLVIFLITTLNLSAQFAEGISFVENVGQILDQNNLPNSEVKYLARKNDFQIQLRKNGFSYELFSENRASNELNNKKKSSGFRVHRIDINFLNKEKSVKILTHDKGSVNRYYLGDKEFLAKKFDQITYKNIWNGVDVDFLSDDKGSQNAFKYNLRVNNSASLKQINFQKLYYSY